MSTSSGESSKKKGKKKKKAKKSTFDRLYSSSTRSSGSKLKNGKKVKSNKRKTPKKRVAKKTPKKKIKKKTTKSSSKSSKPKTTDSKPKKIEPQISNSVSSKKTLAFDESVQSQSSTVFNVQVTFGKLTEKFEVNPHIGMTVSKLYTQFRWTETQKAGIEITGLKDINGVTKNFVEEKDIHFEEIISAKERVKSGKGSSEYFLRPDQTYKLVFQDLRKSAVKLLDKESLSEIKGYFEKMDGDGNGVIDVKEIVVYHDDEYEKEKKSWEKWYENQCKKVEWLRLAWEVCLKDGLERIKLNRERNIKHYKEVDVNNDGLVQWNEFLNCEALFRVGKSNQRIKYFRKLAEGEPVLETGKRAKKKKNGK